MTIADKFNNLNGKTVTIQQLLQIRKEAVETCAINTLEKIDIVLSKAKTNKFKLNITTPVAESLLGIEKLPANHDNLNEAETLSGKSLYKKITDLVIKTINKNPDKLLFEKKWQNNEIVGLLKSAGSKKYYRGINQTLFYHVYPDEYGKKWVNRYFFTRKEISKKGGKLKKGAIHYPVIFYTIGYKYQNDGLDLFSYKKSEFIKQVLKNKYKIPFFSENIKAGKHNEADLLDMFIKKHSFPIIKQYKVWNGEDVEGIDWEKYPDATVTVDEIDFKPIETAEKIVQLYPNKPEIEHKGGQAYYRAFDDIIVMPDKKIFKSEQYYYSTLFHEMIHSTGSTKRLNRNMKGQFGDKDYAFEELIAEIGASFISSEAGILYHHIKNTATYIKSWNKRLIEKLENDSEFIFKASAKAQKAADYILDVDKNGVPKYRKDISTPKKTTKKTDSSVVSQMALFGLDNQIQISSEDFKKMKVSELRKITLDYYNERLNRNKTEIKNHIKEAVFTTSAGKKISKDEPMYHEKAAVIEHIEQIIKKST